MKETEHYNRPEMKKVKYKWLVLILTLAACTADMTGQQPEVKLTSFQSPTVSALTAQVESTATPMPAPTPTPIYHVVAAGETISAIAIRYGVDMAAIMVTNPKVDPNAMSVGTKLLIPPPSSNSGIAGLSATPVPISVGPLICTRSREGGAWCFLNVKNEQIFPVENLIARIIIGNSQTGQLADQLASAPINILYPGQSLPIAAYFSPPLPDLLQTSHELVSALEVQDGAVRYLETRIENLQINIDSNGLSAQISGELLLSDQSSSARKVWLVAVAYDDQGRVAGLRRWESPNPLPTGGRLPFVFNVYSTGANIESVELLKEALR